MTIVEIGAALRSKKLSVRELTEDTLRRVINSQERLNAFITITREQALATAREMEAEQRRGKWRGPHTAFPSP